MPRKAKKTKNVGKKRKSKTKGSRLIKSSAGKKKTPANAVDAVERQAARSRALEARLYFQSAELAKKANQIQLARELKEAAESELGEYREAMEEVSAFTAWQQAHTVERLTDGLRELTLANERLTKERNDLQKRLEESVEASNSCLAARDAEIARLNDIIKECHYRYEKVFEDFAERLAEKLTEGWENEKTYLEDLEEVMCEECLQCGLLLTTNE